MNGGSAERVGGDEGERLASAVELGDVIRWRNALDCLTGIHLPPSVAVGRCLRLARECAHPDAQWLCAQVSAGPAADEAQLARVLEGQGDDPIALFVRAWCGADPHPARDLLLLSARLGYAPAQAVLAGCCEEDDFDPFPWAEKAAAQGDRDGLFQLGLFAHEGRGCPRGGERAVELWRQAAALGHRRGHLFVATHGHGPADWRRYRWLAQGSALGHQSCTLQLLAGARYVLRLFAEGKAPGRIVWELAEGLLGHAQVTDWKDFDRQPTMAEMEALRLCVQMRETWRNAATRAIECWIGVARRWDVAKDVRQLIARMLWEDRWLWAKKV